MNNDSVVHDARRILEEYPDMVRDMENSPYEPHRERIQKLRKIAGV